MNAVKNAKAEVCSICDGMRLLVKRFDGGELTVEKKTEGKNKETVFKDKRAKGDTER